MKPNGYQRHKYSADLYKFVTKQTGSTESSEYYFIKKIALTAGLNLSGQLTIRCDEPIQIGSVIDGIRDTDNNLILGDQSWQVTGLEPVLNAFSTIESYRLRAVKFQGTL